MKIDLNIIQILDLIDRYGSINRAAEILGKVPSGLSHTITKFENQFNIDLLIRQGRSVAISSVGLALLEDGRKLLENINRLEQKILNFESGYGEEFIIGIDNNINPSPLIQLVAKYNTTETPSPITIISDYSPNLLSALLTRKIHFIIGQNLEKASTNINIVNKQLMSAPMVLVIGKNHPLTNTILLNKNDLNSYPWASLNWVNLCNYDHLLFPNEIRSRVNGTIFVPDTISQIKAISMGLGIGLVQQHKLAEYSDNITELYQNSNWNEVFYAAWNTMRMEKILRWFIRQLDNVYTRTALVSNKEIISVTNLD